MTGSAPSLRHLRTLYEAKELAGAVNRIIGDMNHAFLVFVLTQDFLSHDLGLAARNLRKERNPEKRTGVLDEIDTDAVTRRLMDALDVRNRQKQTVPITEAHVAEITEYLEALELITNCPIETTQPGSAPAEHILFTQPGMRCCQVQALVHSLMKDELFLPLSEREKDTVTDRILEEVRGQILENIILLETSNALAQTQCLAVTRAGFTGSRPVFSSHPLRRRWQELHLQNSYKTVTIHLSCKSQPH